MSRTRRRSSTALTLAELRLWLAATFANLTHAEKHWYAVARSTHTRIIANAYLWSNADQAPSDRQMIGPIFTRTGGVQLMSRFQHAEYSDSNVYDPISAGESPAPTQACIHRGDSSFVIKSNTAFLEYWARSGRLPFEQILSELESHTIAAFLYWPQDRRTTPVNVVAQSAQTGCASESHTTQVVLSDRLRIVRLASLSNAIYTSCCMSWHVRRPLTGCCSIRCSEVDENRVWSKHETLNHRSWIWISCIGERALGCTMRAITPNLAMLQAPQHLHVVLVLNLINY